MSVQITILPAAINPITKTTKAVRWEGVTYLLDLGASGRWVEEHAPGYQWERKATEADKDLPWLWRPMAKRLKKVK